jgi:hypothetical protein
LISKLVLREAMAIFNKDAHYVLSTYMGSGNVPYSAIHILTIMLPGLARSLTVGPLMIMCTKEEFNMSSSQAITNTTSATVHFAGSSAGWLANLAKCLKSQNSVRDLCVAMQYPYVEEGPRKQVVCVDLRPLEALLEVLEALTSLELAFLNLSEQQSGRHDVQTACLRLVQAMWGSHVAVAEVSPGENRRFKFTRPMIE